MSLNNKTIFSPSSDSAEAGFTLIETLLVVGIFTALVGLTSVGLYRLIPNTASRASVSTLLADLRQQQIRSQMGEGGTAHGVAFGTGEYVLFTGSTYNPAAPTNRVVTLEPELVLSSTLPSNQVIFAELSGEPTAIGVFQDQIILTNNETDTITTLEINELGVPLVVD